MGAALPQRRTDGQAGPGAGAFSTLFVLQPNIQRRFPSHLGPGGPSPTPSLGLRRGAAWALEGRPFLLYDWEKDERRLATGVGQLLPSVWWDVTREGLAHSLLHAPLGPGLLLARLGGGWEGAAAGRGGKEGGNLGQKQLLCVWTKVSVTQRDNLHEEAAQAPQHSAD